MSQRIYLLALLFLGLSTAFAPPAPRGDEGMKVSDQEALGKQIALYFKARQESKGIDKAKENVDDELKRIGKKPKPHDPLAQTADIGRAVWFANGTDKITNAKKGKVLVQEGTFGEKGKVSYAVYAPEKYAPKNSYPVLLIIPNLDRKPNEHLTVDWIDPQIRDGAILAAIGMPAVDATIKDDAERSKARKEAWKAAPDAGMVRETGSASVMIVLREIAKTYSIDYDRVFLVGTGYGSVAAMRIAGRFPDRFAGVISRQGEKDEELTIENFKNLSVLAQAPGDSAALEELFKKQGYTSNLEVRGEVKETDVWTWMQQHPRQSNPSEVVLVAGSPTPSKAYWIELSSSWDGTGETPIVKAKIDRATNRIEIDADYIPNAKLKLCLNDVLVDLDKPIKVVINGQETTSTIPRSCQRLLDYVYGGRCDPGRIYLCDKDFSVPAKPKPKDKDKEKAEGGK